MKIAVLGGGKSQRADYVVADLVNGYAVYRWPWKLVLGETPQLFNLVEDPFEQSNLAGTETELVQVLQTRLSEWEFAKDPGIPFMDLFFDPDTFGGEEDGRLPWPDAVVQ